MRYVMKCAGLAGTARDPGHRVPVGQYLKRYDPEAHDGQGDAEFTANLADALRFPDQVAAWQLWTTVPKARPVRHYDGQPNRPLAAFHMEIVPEATEPGGAFFRRPYIQPFETGAPRRSPAEGDWDESRD